VVATLGYLAVQLRHNTNSVRSAAFSAWTASSDGIIRPILENERLDQIMREGWNDADGLTEETWMTFVLWHQRFFYHLEMVWQMHLHGTLTKHIFDQEIDRKRELLATPSVRQWWEAGGNRQVSKPLREEIEKRILEESDFVWILWDKETGFSAREA
jgi:hypothetical protein